MIALEVKRNYIIPEYCRNNNDDLTEYINDLLKTELKEFKNDDLELTFFYDFQNNKIHSKYFFKDGKLVDSVKKPFQYGTGLKITKELKEVPEKKAFKGLVDYLTNHARRKKEYLNLNVVSSYIHKTDLKIDIYKYKDNDLVTGLNLNERIKTSKIKKDTKDYLINRCSHDTKYHVCIIPYQVIKEAIYTLNNDSFAKIFNWYLPHLNIPEEYFLFGEKIPVLDRKDKVKLRNKYKRMKEDDMYSSYRRKKEQAIKDLELRIIEIQSEM